MVEIFFSIITRQAIRRGTYRSVKELTAKIGEFIDGWNERCQPFTWTKTAEELLAKIRRKETSRARHSEPDSSSHARRGGRGIQRGTVLLYSR